MCKRMSHFLKKDVNIILEYYVTIRKTGMSGQ
jgi:hypothetical protein